MEKLIYLACKPPAQNIDTFRDEMLGGAAPRLRAAGASQLRIAVADSAIDAAKNKRILSAALTHIPDVLVSFWLNSATQCEAIETILAEYSQAIAGYLVTESEPLVNTRHPATAGQRTPGMNQVVLLRTPARLTRNEWLDLWLNRHTPIAIATQSTFGYRQNIVARALTDNAFTHTLAIDAIVEENFPAEAMTSAHAFYKAINNDGKNDDALLKKNQTDMFTSVQRFIDLDKLDCLPMSEYNF